MSGNNPFSSFIEYDLIVVFEKSIPCIPLITILSFEVECLFHSIILVSFPQKVRDSVSDMVVIPVPEDSERE